MSLFNSNGVLILLHRELSSVEKAPLYDIILSPQFYISRREQLPVKSTFQAKKLAPSILEEYLSSEYDYEYLVEKDGDSWLLYAYSPREIEEFLMSCCDIEKHKIGKIYFADQLKSRLSKQPIGVDEQNALTLIDDRATIVPRSIIDSDNYIKFTKGLRPDKSFKYNSYSNSSGNDAISKEYIMLSVLLILLSLAFLIEGFDYKKSLKIENNKLSDIYNKYPQLQSKLTRDSIGEKYESIEKSERAKRELLDTLSQLTSKKSILTKLEISDNRYTANFKVDKAEIKRVKSIATASNLKVTKADSSLLTIEGVLK